MANRLESQLRSAVTRFRQVRPVVPVGPGPGTGTVHVLAPDFAAPSGGLRVMYRHVDLLNAAGIDAVVLHQKRGFRCSWFENDTRITDVGSAVLGERDVLVVPEIDMDVVARLPRPVRHIVLNQSGHLTWNRAPDVLARHYRTSEHLLGMIAVSAHSEGLLRYTYPERAVRRIHLSLDPSIFHPGSLGERREHTLAYLPRRGGVEVGQVLAMLNARGVLADWTVRPLGGMPQRELADAMRRVRIVLSTSYQEGFGLPPLEAMACGNHVIGFHGFGGREFFRPEFSTAVETGDVVAVAHAVEAAVVRESREPGWCLEQGLAASEFVRSEYSPERERDDVLAAYRELIDTDPRGPGLMPQPRHVDDMSNEPEGAS